MGVYMIVTVFFAVPANYLNDKYGIHVGVILVFFSKFSSLLGLYRDHTLYNWGVGQSLDKRCVLVDFNWTIVGRNCVLLCKCSSEGCSCVVRSLINRSWNNYNDCSGASWNHHRLRTSEFLYSLLSFVKVLKTGKGTVCK